MPKNYAVVGKFGVSVDDSRFEAYLKRAMDLGRMEVRVGILSGKPKYPAGWVGTKSRVKDTMARFEALKGGQRAASMLSAYRSKKKKAPGFKRKKRKKRVSVAKVAAVVGYSGKDGARPKIPSMWRATDDRMSQYIHRQAAEAGRLALDGKDPRYAIQAIGKRMQMEYRADVMRSGHLDTRLLLNTVKWELVDVVREKFMRRLQRARNKARRMARQAAKARR